VQQLQHWQPQASPAPRGSHHLTGEPPAAPAAPVRQVLLLSAATVWVHLRQYRMRCQRLAVACTRLLLTLCCYVGCHPPLKNCHGSHSKASLCPPQQLQVLHSIRLTSEHLQIHKHLQMLAGCSNNSTKLELLVEHGVLLQAECAERALSSQY
jgi:hypothetical protein